MKFSSILQSNINDFISDRLDESYEHLMKNAQYLKEKEKCSHLLAKLNQNFDTITFEKYREKNNLLQYLELQETYKIGFKDSTIIFTNKF